MTRDFQMRVLVIVALVIGARLVTLARGATPMALERPLSAIPLHLEGWRGMEGAALDAETIRVLAADEYVNRIYEHPEFGAVALFIAYYGSQHLGAGIHSPQNCLPGNGWMPVAHSRVAMPASRDGGMLNRYVVEKHGARQVVLYWFQGRGRVEADEYAHKALLFRDAIVRGRSDGALVRIVTPAGAGDALAQGAALAFAARVFPVVEEWLP